MADAAGLDFLLPLGRWKGYGGTTNHNGASFETLTWASGLLAATQQIMAFGTVHVTAINPVVAAKQMVTADHIGRGRFGLNIVCGWYQDEFDMLGVDLGTHDDRYVLGQEWVDIITRCWTEDAPFDYPGRFFQLKKTVMEPKPWGRERPMLVSAGRSGDGKDFAARNADMLFTAIRVDEDEVAVDVADLKRAAAAHKREIGVFTNVYVVCRPTAKEAEDYHHWYAVEMADKDAVETMVVERGLDRENVPEFGAPRLPRARGRRQRRLARHRRSRHGGREDGPPRRARHLRPRHGVRQLSRRLPLFPRRGAAPAGTERAEDRAGCCTLKACPFGLGSDRAWRGRVSKYEHAEVPARSPFDAPCCARYSGRTASNKNLV